MPSYRQIAKHWGVVNSYVAKLVKKGMPTDSFEAADAWRDANARKRAPTHHKTIAKEIAVELDDDSTAARERRTEYLGQHSNGTPTPSTDLDQALNHAIELENEAYRMARDAMELDQESKIQIRLAIHNKAQENRVKIESMIREERQHRQDLIPYHTATDIFRRGLDVILRRLKRFPQEKAPACNPQNPLHALGVLEASVDDIIKEAQEQYVFAEA